MTNKEHEQELEDILKYFGPDIEYDLIKWVFEGKFPHDNPFLVAIIENNLYNALKERLYINRDDWLPLIDALPPESHGVTTLWKGLNNGGTWQKQD